MRFFRYLTVAAVLVLPAAAASAQTIPDMKGTWSGMSHSVVMGTHGHHADNRQPADKPFLASREFTMIIEGQDGRRFWGTVVSNHQREPFVAIFRLDGKSFIGADEDGTMVGDILGANSFDGCYTQTVPAKALVASCTTYTKR